VLVHGDAERLGTAQRTGESQYLDGLEYDGESASVSVIPVSSPSGVGVVGALVVWNRSEVPLPTGPHEPLHQGRRLASLAIMNEHTAAAASWDGDHDVPTGLLNRAGLASVRSGVDQGAIIAIGITGLDWNFGDGNTSSDVAPNNVFANIGSYTVTLIVTDDDGATDLVTQSIDAELAPGCYDSTANALSVIYTGPWATYKNAHIATNGGSCGSNLTGIHTTLVQAADQAAGLAACQAGPDPAADAATSLNAIGFGMLPSITWSCTNPASSGLLPAGTCYPIGTASVEYVGPRNTLNNANLHAGTTCATAIDSSYTYVQHSTEASALGVCQSIDPAFATATAIGGVFPTMPADTYLCQV
jgi:hypothetical protein